MAVLETRVHLEAYSTEEPYMAIEVFIEDDDVAPVGSLEARWPTDLAYTGHMASQWLREGSSLALAVPSALVPGEALILLNPAHPNAERLRTIRRLAFSWDHRLF